MTLELPNRDNKPWLSRIPGGNYDVEYLERSASGKFTDCYHLKNVSGRSGILIHAGNYAGDKHLGFKTHSSGCILPVCAFRFADGQLMGVESAKAMDAIHKLTGRKSFKLEVI